MTSPALLRIRIPRATVQSHFWTWRTPSTLEQVSLPPTALDVDEEETPAPVKTRSRSRSLTEWGIVVVVAVIVSLLIRTFVFQTFFIPSGSMEPTLQIGDRIIVSKLSVEFGTIHTGDILVFKAPKAVATVCGDDVADLVKRVIGLPGQTLTSKGNTIYYKNPGDQTWHRLKQPWLQPGVPLGKAIGTVHVTSNHYFMVGDNESDSCDSRYWGTIPRSSIIGKAFLRIWPLSRFDFL
jgi:signal peptidase I